MIFIIKEKQSNFFQFKVGKFLLLFLILVQLFF